MKAVEWKRLSKSPLSSVGGDWSWTRLMAYLSPVTWLLHGVLAEGSQFRSNEFYLWIVRAPLMVPTDGVVDLSWSRRLGGGSATFDPSEPATSDAIAEAGRIALANAGRSALALDVPNGTENALMQEARAYSLLLGGYHGEALDTLSGIQSITATYAWESDLVRRASTIFSLVASGQADLASEQLRRWRDENCSALRLICD